MESDSYELFFDGCSKGNPGRSGAGAVLYKNNNELATNSLFIGDKETNNSAEYNGLIIGLEMAIKYNIKNLVVKGDSLLVIQQMTGKYQVKSNSLLQLYTNVKKLEKLFTKVVYQHVYRHDNKRADELANASIVDVTTTYL
jgi:ribonuclease HI